MRTVTTQAKLDAAGSEWVMVEANYFEARGSAHVVAWESAHVVAWESAHVEAWESAHVEARGSAHVEAWESAHVEAWESAHVVARGSAHVVARGSAHVVARDFASIVFCSDCAQITLGPKAVLIKPEYSTDVIEWADNKDVQIKDGRIYLWKAVQQDGTDFRTGKLNYLLSETVAPDWDVQTASECGRALHLSDSPSGARYFVPRGDADTFRLLLVSAAVSDCVCFGGQPQYPMKLRARACRFECEYPRDFNDYKVADEVNA